MTETAIADHGLIGDLQTCALVDHRRIDRLVLRARGSTRPSIFGGAARPRARRPLPDRAGRRSTTRTQAALLPGHRHPDHPVPERGRRRRGRRLHAGRPATTATDRHRLVRMVQVRARRDDASGSTCAPRFDYGRDAHETECRDDGAVFTASATSLTLHVVREPGDERLARVQVERRRRPARRRSTSWPGEVGGVVLETAADGPPRRDARRGDPASCSTTPCDFWRAWLGRSTYTGRWREARRAVGDHAQADDLRARPAGWWPRPTAGLPEQVGGERNWDYRYTWVRDASFSVHALLRLGFTDEAAAFAQLARRPGRRERRRQRQRPAADHVPHRRLARPRRGDPRPLGGLPRLAPGADRQRRGRPAAARHLRRGAGQHLPRRPARAAACRTRAGRASAALLDWLADNWDQPEEGIWETRGGRQDFTYGRLMCWVAFDRGIRTGDRPRPARRPRPLDGRARRHLRADHGAGLAPASARRSSSTTTPTSWTPRCCACRRSASSRPTDPMWQSTLRGDGRRAGLRQPGLPLRPRGLPRRAARLGGHVLAVHLLVRRRAGPGRPARRGAADLREDADLRQPPRPVLRGDRARPASRSATSPRRSPTWR